MTMTDDELKTYLDKYGSRLNPHGRKELANYLIPRIAEAARIDPETALTCCFNHGDGRSAPPGLYDALGGDPPEWLQAYLWLPERFARAPSSELWVRFDLLSDAVRKRLTPPSQVEWSPEEQEIMAERDEYIRAVKAEPERGQYIKKYLADVKAEAQRIDVDAEVEVFCCYAAYEDPYGIYGLPPELSICSIGKETFVRRLPDGFGVLLEDLPADMQLKLRNKRSTPSAFPATEGWLGTLE
jgi:hypothetical protein